MQATINFTNYTEKRKNHWGAIARRPSKSVFTRFYQNRLAEVYRTIIPAGSTVLELGSGTGDLLAALSPEVGVGIDFSPIMVEVAQKHYPELTFFCQDAHTFELDQKFEYIILSDLIDDVWDVQKIIEQVIGHCLPETRIIINFYSRLWEIPLLIAKSFRLANPLMTQNWLVANDVKNIFSLMGIEMIRSWSEFLFPFPFLYIDQFFNKFLVKIFPFNFLALVNMIVARPVLGRNFQSQPKVTIVVPARNEAGNIESIFKRVPQMGSETEIIFVEGGSTDNTYNKIKQVIQNNPGIKSRLYRQSGRGKGDAVRLAFSKAEGDILMILDADLSVSPEDLPKFYHALVENKAEFVNGSRLVYPMAEKAMKSMNLVANKFFSLAFTWLLGQSIKDTLCGTKVLYKEDYLKIANNRAYFGDFDQFGDFDLLLGAAKLHLKIVDLPIRYQERTYGTTNIQRWKHGWLLLRMVCFAALRLKFK